MPDKNDQLVHLSEYFKIIRNRLWVIFTIFALTVLSGYYVTNQVLPKVYSSTSQIQIRPHGQVEISGIQNNSVNAQIDMMAFQAEFTIMQSSNVLLPIIQDLQLDKIWAKRVYKSGLEALPPQDALAYMDRILHLDYVKGTNIINITISSEVPRECSDVANALADRYKTMRDVEDEQRNDRGIDALNDQISQQQKVVEDARAKVEKMRQDLGNRGIEVPSGGDMTERAESDLQKKNSDLLSAEGDYQARLILFERINKLNDEEFVNTAKAVGRDMHDVDALNEEVLSLQTNIQNLLNQGYADNHPSILAIRAQIEERHKQVTDLIAGYRRAMQVDVDISKKHVDLIQEQVDKLTQQIRLDTTKDLVPFHDAQREMEKQQTLLDTLSIKLQQDKADMGLMVPAVRIISRAQPPSVPTRPNKSMMYGVSAAAGLFVGLCVAFLIEYLDTSVKTMADAETLLGLPVLTVIPNKGGPMPLVQDTGRLPHAEGYRILRAKLDLKVQNGIGPSLTMLSGGPGEGKSTTIFNLAIVCAQAGQSVILVDCDLRRPTLHELIGISNERGLSNFLRGEGEAASFVQRTAIPKLHCLSAGNMPMSEIGVLAGDKIRMMLDDLKQRYDLVLIDAPPVLGISDGSIIAREVDYVILVIQHRRYPREISLRAKRAIEEVHGNCVGMVLNCVAVKSDDAYYYYSSYGNYYKKKSERPNKRKDVAKANGKPVAAAARKMDLDSDEF